jgi:hypothetical protein
MAEKVDLQLRKVITPVFRVSFPAILKPKAFEGKEAEYSVVMLFDKDIDLGKPAKGQKNSLKRAAFYAAVEKWGKDKTKWPRNLKMPFRDGEEKSDVDGYEGTIFITARSKTQPNLVDQRLRPITSEDDFYAGCYAHAEVMAAAFDNSGNKGVSFWLQNIQKVRDGEPFSGRLPADQVFGALESDDDEETDGEESYDLGF